MKNRICSDCGCKLRKDEKDAYWHGELVCNICYRKLFYKRKHG